MSAPTEPFANGFGILIGIVILWVGTLAICAAVRYLLPAAQDAATEPAGELQGRAAVTAPLEVASARR